MATDGEAMPLSIYLANNSMVGESFNYFRDQIEEVVGNVGSLNVTVNELDGTGNHYRCESMYWSFLYQKIGIMTMTWAGRLN